MSFGRLPTDTARWSAESQEQQRFFDDMLLGRDDLLGRRHANTGTGGGVLSMRWRE